MKIVHAGLAALVLTGCAIRPHNYRAPVSGPTATVIFRNMTGFGSGSVSIYEEAARCSRRSMIYNVGFDSTKKVMVKADKELALTYGAGEQFGNVLQRCRVTASFLPAVNQTYEVALLRRMEFCALAVNRTPPQRDGKLEPVAVTMRVPNEHPFNENSDFCKPL